MKEQFTYDQAIKLFEIQQQAISIYQQDMTKSINARTIAETDRVSEKMDGMIERQDKMNNNVADNVKAIAINNKTTEKVNRISGSLKWYVLGLFGFCYSICWIYDSFNLKEIIKKLILKL